LWQEEPNQNHQIHKKHSDMIIGLDAFNISSGGGITHLKNILEFSDPSSQNFTKIILWGSTETLNKIPDKDWIEKKTHPLLNKSGFHRIFWHIFKSKNSANYYSCDVIYTPGGINLSGFDPSITMSRNMLPFEWLELKRYSTSKTFLRLFFLKYLQLQSFKRASGLIFLTKYAENIIKKNTNLINDVKKKIVNIPHGVSSHFFKSPKLIDKNKFINGAPCNILYVSGIELHKHQWNVIEAVANARARGYLINLYLVGPQGHGSKLLYSAIKKYDPKLEFVRYKGEVNHNNLNAIYEDCDISLFASSCENMPNILLESMASGLPILSSNMGPMPEILGENGIYFNPLSVDEIENAIVKSIESIDLMFELSKKSFMKAKSYSWKNCADETFKFIHKIANKSNKDKM